MKMALAILATAILGLVAIMTAAVITLALYLGWILLAVGVVGCLVVLSSGCTGGRQLPIDRPVQPAQCRVGRPDPATQWYVSCAQYDTYNYVVYYWAPTIYDRRPGEYATPGVAAPAATTVVKAAPPALAYGRYPMDFLGLEGGPR